MRQEDTDYDVHARQANITHLAASGRISSAANRGKWINFALKRSFAEILARLKIRSDRMRVKKRATQGDAAA
ncbi:MAG: hypothetical protein ACFNVQ_00015 [Campylobacter sp.]